MWSAVQKRVATYAYAITHIYRYGHNTIILEHETNKNLVHYRRSENLPGRLSLSMTTSLKCILWCFKMGVLKNVEFQTFRLG